MVDGQIRIRVDIYNHTEQPPPSTASTIIQKPGEPRSNGKEPPNMSDFVLQDDQEVVTAIAPGDVVGNPITAPFDTGSVTVTSAVPTVLTVTLSADQSSYTATAVGPEETGVTVTVNGTVGGTPVTSTLTFDVTASPAATVIQTPGTPTTIPGDAGTPPAATTTNPPTTTDTTNPPPPAS